MTLRENAFVNIVGKEENALFSKTFSALSKKKKNWLWPLIVVVSKC